MTAVDTLITELRAGKYSSSPQNIIAKVEDFILALQQLQGGSTVNGACTAVTVFSATGTWTPNAATKSAMVYLWGGGGGGGGALGAAASVGVGAGGCSGTFEQSFIMLASGLIVPATITIGAGGTAGDVTGSNGTQGGTSSIGAWLTAPGGLGGAGDTGPSALPGMTIPGAGGGLGAPGGNIFDMNGSQGGPGIRLSGTVGTSGYGGSSPNGGRGGIARVNAQATGQAGLLGAGGGGGLSNPTSRAGGAGGNGYAIIQEFG